MDRLLSAMEPEPAWFAGPNSLVWRWRIGDGSHDCAETPEGLAQAGRGHLTPPAIGYVWTDAEGEEFDAEQRAAIVQALRRVGPAFVWQAAFPRAHWRTIQDMVARGRLSAEKARAANPILWKDTPLAAAADRVAGPLTLPDGRPTQWGAVRLRDEDVAAAATWLRGTRWLVTDRNQRWPERAARLAAELEVEGKQKVDVIARLVAEGEMALEFHRPEVFATHTGTDKIDCFVRDAAVVCGSAALVRRFMAELERVVPAVPSTPRELGHVVADLA